MSACFSFLTATKFQKLRLFANSFSRPLENINCKIQGPFKIDCPECILQLLKGYMLFICILFI